MPEYELFLDNDKGSRLRLLDDVVNFEWTRTTNTVAKAKLTMPGDFDRDLLQVDNLLELWRTPRGGAKSLEFMGFLRDWEWSQDSRGLTTIKLSFADLNCLLARPIVAYAQGSAQADMTDYADDMMKEIVRDNLGADATDTDRDLTSSTNISGITFTIAPNIGGGPQISKQFARLQVLDVLREIVEAAKADVTTPTDIFFGIVPLSPTRWEFQTRTGRWGTDRRWPSGAAPLIFGEDFGNLSNPNLKVSRMSEITYVYIGGSGESASRTVTELSASVRINDSQWNRFEAWRDGRMAGSSASAQKAVGYAALSAGRPCKDFSGRILSTEITSYGRDWFFGDEITATAFGEQVDAQVLSVHGSVNSLGNEIIMARIEADLS